MSLEILHRYSRVVIYESATAQTIAEAVIEARGKGADLKGANLKGANLEGANLDKWSTIMIASRHVVTVYPNRISIGCHTRTLAKWLDGYKRIGMDQGYTTEEIAEYGEILLRIQKLYEVMG